jgi:hypothetical protein
MKHGSARLSDDVLSDAQSQFERWRSRRARGTRIPAILWQAAIDAAREHGVSKVSQALRLDYYGLKKRLESALSGPEPGSGLGFLEIPLCGPSAAECVLELEDGQGSRLRVELKGAAPAELETLARAFWSMAR